MVSRSARPQSPTRKPQAVALPLSSARQTFGGYSADQGAEGTAKRNSASHPGRHSRKDSHAPGSTRLSTWSLDPIIRHAAHCEAHGIANGSEGVLPIDFGRARSRPCSAPPDIPNASLICWLDCARTARRPTFGTTQAWFGTTTEFARRIIGIRGGIFRRARRPRRPSRTCVPIVWIVASADWRRRPVPFTPAMPTIWSSRAAEISSASSNVSACTSRPSRSRRVSTSIIAKRASCAKASRNDVAGIIVNERLNVRRQDYDRLKAILTNCVRHGTSGQNREQLDYFRAHLRGRISFVETVHAERGMRLRAIFDKIVLVAIDLESSTLLRPPVTAFLRAADRQSRAASAGAGLAVELRAADAT